MPKIPHFTLDSEGLRASLTERLNDGDTELPFNESWSPREDTEIGSTVDRLIQDLDSDGFLTHPWQSATIYTEYEDGESDYMQYVVKLTAPGTSRGSGIALVTMGCEGRKLGTADTYGVEAAVDLLAEMVTYANAAIDDLVLFTNAIEQNPEN